jgi:transcriptional regulator with AAA-type ATPase domain
MGIGEQVRARLSRQKLFEGQDPRMLRNLGPRPVPFPPPEVLAAARAYPWPGNVRELCNL